MTTTGADPATEPQWWAPATLHAPARAHLLSAWRARGGTAALCGERRRTWQALDESTQPDIPRCTTCEQHAQEPSPATATAPQHATTAHIELDTSLGAARPTRHTARSERQAAIYATARHCAHAGLGRNALAQLLAILGLDPAEARSAKPTHSRPEDTR